MFTFTFERLSAELDPLATGVTRLGLHHVLLEQVVGSVQLAG